MSAIAEITPKTKTGRGRISLSPSVGDDCRPDWNRKLVSALNIKQTGSFAVILAFESCTCESVGLQR